MRRNSKQIRMFQLLKFGSRNLFRLSDFQFRLMAALSAFTLLASPSYARLKIVPPRTEPFVFSGRQRQIEVIIDNQADTDVETPVSTRIYQATSATLAPVGPEQRWKKLRMLAGQKVIEKAALDFPDVRAVTAFQVRWSTEDNAEIGRTTVQVVPTNILGGISILARDQVVGLVDLGGLLKPVLKGSGIQFEDVDSFAGFSGNLVLIGPSAEPEATVSSLKADAKRPITVLWIRESASSIGVVPNLYFVMLGQARVAVADAKLFADLENSALAQINLLRCIRVAQHPEELKLPMEPKP